MLATLISLSPHKMKINAVGVRILSSCLKRDGWDVRILFLPRENVGDLYEESVLNDIVDLSEGSDLIGISLMTDDLPNVINIDKKIKQELNVPTVWGGIHPTIRPAESLQYTDMVCLGEGEETFVELARRIKSRGFRMMTTLGGKSVYCLMYKSFFEAFNGFSKNFYLGFNTTRPLFLMMIVFFVVIYLLPFFLVFVKFIFVMPIILIYFQRIILAFTDRQNPVINALMHPIQMVFMFIIGIYSIRIAHGKRIIWKDRRI